MNLKSDNEESDNDNDDAHDIIWSDPDPNMPFVPRLTMSSNRKPQLCIKIFQISTELDVFL